MPKKTLPSIGILFASIFQDKQAKQPVPCLPTIKWRPFWKAKSCRLNRPGSARLRRAMLQRKLQDFARNTTNRYAGTGTSHPNGSIANAAQPARRRGVVRPRLRRDIALRHYQQVRRFGRLTSERERVYGRTHCSHPGAPNPTQHVIIAKNITRANTTTRFYMTAVLWPPPQAEAELGTYE